MLPNKVYDILKLVSVLAIPVVDFIALMSTTWGWSWGVPVATTVSGIGILAGAIITSSSSIYKKSKEE